MDSVYYIYILTNFDKNVLYIGFTNDIVRRIIEHRNGIGSKFTTKYRLKYLVYFEEYKYVDDAIAREKELKGWKRDKKNNLIKTINPNFLDMSIDLFTDYGISEEEIDDYVEGLKL